MEAKIAALRDEARYSTPYQSTELLSNADVLERYMYYQGHRTLRLAPPLAADLVRSDVEIRVRPSLFAIEDEDRRRLIFLELREKSNAAAMRVVAELAFEAFRSVLCNLPPHAVQVIDVRRGYVTELQQAGTSIGHELASACKEISYVWPRLAPPKGSQPIARTTERQMSIPWDFDA
jgi:hypothetical protein